MYKKPVLLGLLNELDRLADAGLFIYPFNFAVSDETIKSFDLYPCNVKNILYNSYDHVKEYMFLSGTKNNIMKFKLKI